jgi:ligand-binding sensor protein
MVEAEVVHSDSNKQLIDNLRRSKLFRRYEQVFSEATGLPLTLRPVDYWQLEHQGKKHQNRFCAMLAERPATLAVCLQAHQDIIDHTGLIPHTVTCPFGLTETAVPVRLGAQIIGYLRIGQVLRHRPAKSQSSKVSRELERHGVRFNGEIRKAWENTPLTPPDKYNATVRLLTFFAEQLSALANQLMLEQQNAEPPLVQKARMYITKHKNEELSLADVAKAAGASVFHFCKVFHRSHRTEIHRLRRACAPGRRAKPVAEPKSARQRNRIRRRLSIAHPIQSHIQTRVRPITHRISGAHFFRQTRRESRVIRITR